MTTNSHRSEGLINWVALGLLAGSLLWLIVLGKNLFDAYSMERFVAQNKDLESRTPVTFMDEVQLRADRALLADYEGTTTRAVEALAESGPLLGVVAVASAAGLIWIRQRRRLRAAALRASRLPAESQAFLKDLEQFADSVSDHPNQPFS